VFYCIVGLFKKSHDNKKGLNILSIYSQIIQKPISILIVDDEVELATLFKEYFESSGMYAVSFTNPLLALEYFKEGQNKFSLVITDLRMPGLCGLELAEKIRELDESVNIFLMTAFDTNDLEKSESYRSARIDKLIQKPIKLGVLKMIIEETSRKRVNNCV
jgi:DNA-binding response OmpR family regulator